MLIPAFCRFFFSFFNVLAEIFLGTVIFIFLEVPASAFALIFMDFVPLSVIFFKFLHPEKLFAPMEMIFFPIVRVLIFLLFLAAFFRTEVTLKENPLIFTSDAMVILRFLPVIFVTSAVPPFAEVFVTV